MNLLEKILAIHSGNESVIPGQIIDIDIDIRAARDFGGANVILNLQKSGLDIDDPQKTFFTFDCNPTGSDQKYAVNQHICRQYAREHGIRIYDIDAGIGTHILIDNGHAWPGSTAVSTDSHANVLGAIGSFGQGMGDMDISAAWHKGKAWFKVPPSVLINLTGKLAGDVTSKDIVLNLLKKFGANSLLGYSIEIQGPVAEALDLDDRITISSMATEMGAIIIIFPPSGSIIDYCAARTRTGFNPVFADEDAKYERIFDIDVSDFRPMASLPGAPHDTIDVSEIRGTKIDSAFIGSCTNGRMNDMRKAASILRGRKTAPGVVLKIVPSTDNIWKQCLEEGLLAVFKDSGALVSNAGCAGCAAGQVGQNGPGEVTVSTGNRNFPGKQGRGNVYLASPAVVAASAVAGYITDPANIPDKPAIFEISGKTAANTSEDKKTEAVKREPKADIIEGRVWIIPHDNIDTDMIFHNRYLSVTDIKEMGKYTFDNLKGFEDFSKKAEPGDIVIAGKNFGSGSSRQQAVDCFISLGISAVLAESFGAIYERNAINAGFPVIILKNRVQIDNGDRIRVNLLTGIIENLSNGSSFEAEPFSEVQYDIYKRGGLLF